MCEKVQPLLSCMHVHIEAHPRGSLTATSIPVPNAPTQGYAVELQCPHDHAATASGGVMVVELVSLRDTDQVCACRDSAPCVLVLRQKEAACC